MDSLVYIPTNYTDAGKLFGMFEIRHVVEAVILCLPTTLLMLSFIPLSLTAAIIACAVVVIPLGGFALIGIHDYSLFTFFRLYRRWHKNRRILVYRGSTWINKSTKKKSRV